MAKALSLLVMLGVSTVAAGLFGALHNQVSYSVGPTYFTDLKFNQFRLPEELRTRVGVSWIGWQASWWMGAFVALPGFLMGLMYAPNAVTFRRTAWRAVAWVFVLVSLAAGLACVVGQVWLTDVIAAQLPLPVHTEDALGFARAGLMHEASYFGGALCALVTLWMMWPIKQTEG